MIHLVHDAEPQGALAAREMGFWGRLFRKISNWWFRNILRRLPRLVWYGQDIDVTVSFADLRLSPESTIDPNTGIPNIKKLPPDALGIKILLPQNDKITEAMIEAVVSELLEYDPDGGELASERARWILEAALEAAPKPECTVEVISPPSSATLHDEQINEPSEIIDDGVSDA